jgi:hypothetical protein
MSCVWVFAREKVVKWGIQHLFAIYHNTHVHHAHSHSLDALEIQLLLLFLGLLDFLLLFAVAVA